MSQSFCAWEGVGGCAGTDIGERWTHKQKGTKEKNQVIRKKRDVKRPKSLKANQSGYEMMLDHHRFKDEANISVDIRRNDDRTTDVPVLEAPSDALVPPPTVGLPPFDEELLALEELLDAGVVGG